MTETGEPGSDDSSDGDGRVLTVPNVISVGRLLCVPLFLWLLFGRDNRLAAAILLGFLGATDWVDGWIARRYDQVSTVGKILDPVADRVLLVVGVVAILVDGSVPVVVAVAAIVREVLVSVGLVALTALGAKRIDVQWAGKAGTFALMAAFPLFLAANADLAWETPLRVLAWGFALVGLGFSYWSALAYVPRARVALREGREGRGGRRPAAGPGEGAGRIGSDG